MDQSAQTDSTGCGWRRTDRPLKIAILGWARLSMQAWEGSGYNLSASELARGLAMSGHEVFYLSAGITYRWRRGPHIVARESWGGVTCYELRNSPNVSPSAANFACVETETSCPEESALVVEWLDEIGAQVVHIHSLEGYGLDLIAAIRRGRELGDGARGASRPVVVTPHNYWYVCPQVDLLHHEVRVCMDYEGGLRCVGCLPAQDVRTIKRERAVRQVSEELLGPNTPEALKLLRTALAPVLGRVLRGKAVERYVSGPINPDRLVDPELGRGFEGVGCGEPTAADDGLIRHDLPLGPGEGPLQLEPSAPDINERFLKADHHLKVLNRYGKRRAAGIEALNAASMVIPPSRFLLRAHVVMGLIENKARWVRLGQPHFDQINRRTRRSPFYDVSPWDPGTEKRPLRLAFFGTTRNNKGLEVLLQAIPLLERGVRQRCQFTVRAMGRDWGMRKRMSVYPEVTFLGGYDLLQMISAGGEYDVGLLPHIWFENSPLVMLEHLHAGKFVIASNLGGPPDWITPPKNGLLFTAGSAPELGACITSLVEGEVRVPSPREIHEVSVLRSYPAHVQEVEEIYHEVLAQTGPAARAGVPTGVAAALGT